MPRHEPFDRRRRGLLIAGGALVFAVALRRSRALAQATGGAKLRIGVIGSGRLGGTIGGLWVKAGHPVLFSSRHPDELKDLVARLGPLARAGMVAQAIDFGDALFIAVPYGALPQLGQDYGDALKSKIVLDACNAVAARDGPIAEEVERDAIGITSQKYLPGTRLVRAFNTLSYTIFAREANRFCSCSAPRTPAITTHQPYRHRKNESAGRNLPQGHGTGEPGSSPPKLTSSRGATDLSHRGRQ